PFRALDNKPPLFANPRPPLRPPIRDPSPPPDLPSIRPIPAPPRPPINEPNPPPAKTLPALALFPDIILANISGPTMPSNPFPTVFQSIPAFLNFSSRPSEDKNPGLLTSSGAISTCDVFLTN